MWKSIYRKILLKMNKERDDFLYKKELEECVQDCKIRRFLRNGYCPSCDSKNLKKSKKFWSFNIKYICKNCGFEYIY